MKNIILALTLVPTVMQTGLHKMCHAPLFPETITQDVAKVNAADAKCLAVTIYGEARGESTEGKIAVAYTVVNRATVKSICKIALAPMQYSIFNDNPYLRSAALNANIMPRQNNIIEKAAWEESVKVAHQVLQKEVADPTNGATHYVAYDSLEQIPEWTFKLAKTVKIQNHTFFKEPEKKYIASM